MTIPDILNELNRRGIDIELAGEKIRLHGSSKDDFEKSLVDLIKAHKAEIIATLTTNVGTDLKSRPNWCLGFQFGRYETDDTGSQVLCCGLADQAVFDLQKCVKGYWIKNENNFPVTAH